jgi:acetolactate synthase-1/2/3 large subunit
MSTQKNYFQGRFVGSDPSSQLTLPDVRKVAEAFGIPSAELVDHKDIQKNVRAILDSPGPMVCAVRVSSTQPTAPRATSSARADGTVVSLPMEDMAPRLPRDIFHAEMIIPLLEE